MRELFDNLYLFSLSSDSYGEIVAQRSCDGLCAEGRNVFEYLGVDRSELLFLNNACGGNKPSVLIGTRGGEKRVILFEVSSLREINLGVAMELLKPTMAVARAYVGMEALLSSKASETLAAFEDMPYDVVGEMSLSRSVAYLCSLRDDPLDHLAKKDTATLFGDIFSSVAEIVCVPIECLFDCNEVSCNATPLLHINACLFAVLAMAMAAREYSPDRRLRAIVSERGSFVSVSLGFECGERKWQGERLLREIITDGDLICELCERDGKVICAVAPCYMDEGLQGVKENMNALQMLEFWK